MKENFKGSRSGIRFPYAVPSFISKPQLLKLGLFAVYIKHFRVKI